MDLEAKDIWFRQIQSFLLVAYAVSLPLSMTLSWGILIAGCLVLILQLCFHAQGLFAFKPPFTCVYSKAPPLTVPLAIFVFALALSGAFNGGIKESLASVFSLKPLIVYFWAYAVICRRRQILRPVLMALLATGAFAGLVGCIEQVGNFHPFGYHWLQGTGFLGGPMPFAGQMQILSLMGLGMVWGKRSSFISSSPYIVALLVAGNCLGIVFAAERSAWIGFAAGLLTMAVLAFGKTVLKYLLLLPVFLVLPVVRARLLLDWHKDVSVRVRLFLWQQSLQLFHLHPWLGIGIRNFPHFQIPEAIVPGRSSDINHAHSNYLQILTTTGIVGFCAYLWLWFQAAKCSLANYRLEDRDQAALSLGILGATVALLVSGCFEYNFGTAQVRLMQWFVLAILVRVQSPLQAVAAMESKGHPVHHS